MITETLGEYLEKQGYGDRNLTEDALKLRVHRPEIINIHGVKTLKFDVEVNMTPKKPYPKPKPKSKSWIFKNGSKIEFSKSEPNPKEKYTGLNNALS